MHYWLWISPDKTAREDTQWLTVITLINGMNQYHNMYNLALIDDLPTKVFVICWMTTWLAACSLTYPFCHPYLEWSSRNDSSARCAWFGTRGFWLLIGFATWNGFCLKNFKFCEKYSTLARELLDPTQLPSWPLGTSAAPWTFTLTIQSTSTSPIQYASWALSVYFKSHRISSKYHAAT